jgi:hypothetical protein
LFMTWLTHKSNKRTSTNIPMGFIPAIWTNHIHK